MTDYRLNFMTCLVNRIPAEQMLSHLSPVRLDLDGLTGILESILIVAFLGVGSGSVTEQDMVWGVEGQGFGVALHGLVNVKSGFPGSSRSGEKARKKWTPQEISNFEFRISDLSSHGPSLISDFGFRISDLPFGRRDACPTRGSGMSCGAAVPAAVPRAGETARPGSRGDSRMGLRRSSVVPG